MDKKKFLIRSRMRVLFYTFVITLLLNGMLTVSSTMISSLTIRNFGRIWGQSVWRPFSDDSLWNTKIPDNPLIHSDSDQIVNWLTSSAGRNNGHLHISIYQWTMPVVHADSATPRYTVYNRYTGGVMMNNVPIPDNAQPDPQGDHHLCIIEDDEYVEYDFWNLQYYDGAWRAGSCGQFDLAGSGVSENHVVSARASGFPLIAGLIRPEEIKAGVIPHALVFAVYYCKSDWKVYPPASTTDGWSGDYYAIPEGTRLQLDPSLTEEDFDNWGLSPAGKTIARCLQEYGMFCGDNSGGFDIYAESTLTADWTGLLGDGDAWNIDPNYWRVIDPGDNLEYYETKGIWEHWGG